MKPMFMIFAILGSMISITASAADVAVFPAAGVNLSAGELDAVGEVFSQAFAANSKKTILHPAQTRQAVSEKGSAPEAAAALGVSQYIKLNLVRLDQKINVSAALFESSGQEVFSAKMSALSLDDLEQVADRLSRSLIDRVDPDKTMDMHNVTVKETTEENRVFSEKINGIKVSALGGLSSDGKGDAAVVGAQYDLRLEAKNFFLEFGVGFTLPSAGGERKYGRLFLEIGGSYYLMDTDTAPYVGVGVIPSIFIGPNNDGDGVVNLAPYLQAGVMFMRPSSTRVYVDLRISHDLFPHGNNLFDMTPNGDEKQTYRVTELGLLVGIGW